MKRIYKKNKNRDSGGLKTMAIVIPEQFYYHLQYVAAINGGSVRDIVVLALSKLILEMSPGDYQIKNIVKRALAVGGRNEKGVKKLSGDNGEGRGVSDEAVGA